MVCFWRALITVAPLAAAQRQTSGATIILSATDLSKSEEEKEQEEVFFFRQPSLEAPEKCCLPPGAY